MLVRSLNIVSNYYTPRYLELVRRKKQITHLSCDLFSGVSWPEHTFGSRFCYQFSCKACSNLSLAAFQLCVMYKYDLWVDLQVLRANYSNAWCLSYKKLVVVSCLIVSHRRHKPAFEFSVCYSIVVYQTRMSLKTGRLICVDQFSQYLLLSTAQ